MFDRAAPPEQVRVVGGDIGSDDFHMSELDYQAILRDVDVIINCGETASSRPCPSVPHDACRVQLTRAAARDASRGGWMLYVVSGLHRLSGRDCHS
jgi:hypothetical protein